MKIALLSLVLNICGLLVVAQNGSNSESTAAVISTTIPAEVSSLSSTLTTGGTTKHPETTCSDRWAVHYKNDTSRYCIIMQADIVVKITHNNQTKFIRVDRNASHSGSCESSNNENIIITNDEVKIEWMFTKNMNDSSFNITEIQLTYSNETGSSSVNISWLSNIDSNKLYQCFANETVFKGTLTKTNTEFIITTGNLRLEAFQNTTQCEFKENHDVCADDTNVSNLVPIIVGACLVGLIIIVLIAYLVGRRRSRRGYESV